MIVNQVEKLGTYHGLARKRSWGGANDLGGLMNFHGSGRFVEAGEKIVCGDFARSQITDLRHEVIVGPTPTTLPITPHMTRGTDRFGATLQGPTLGFPPLPEWVHILPLLHDENS